MPARSVTAETTERAAMPGQIRIGISSWGSLPGFGAGRDTQGFSVGLRHVF